MVENTLAIIPARGGSKRVTRKNLREVAGKPLIAHTIQHANEASKIERAIVSTDDEEIADVAEEHGGEVPFMRPTELATDTASTADVIKHALDWASAQPDEFASVCVLQVTSPLRTSEDIDNALQIFDTKEIESVVSISKYMNPPQWAMKKNEEGYLSEFFNTGLLSSETPDRSQEMPELYYPNGALFAATIEFWDEHESFYTPQTVGYQMPPERSFDIDEPWELELVRKLMD